MSRMKLCFNSGLVVAVLLFFGITTAYAQRGGGSSSGRLVIPTQQSGKVLMEDGTPPPEPVVVEQVCGNSVPIPVARTDSKGGFVVGSERRDFVDARLGGAASRAASSSGGAPYRVPQGCAVQARLAGYQSTSITVISDTVNDLGTIILRKLTGVEGTTTSATSLKAPKDAKKAYEKGLKAIDKQKWDEARTQLEMATKTYPEYAAAWFDLGRAYQASGDLPKATEAYKQAIAVDPKFIKPYLQLAPILNHDKKWKEMAELTSKAIQLNPYDFPSAYLYNTLSNLNLGDAKAAEASARQAVKIDTKHLYPQAEFILGAILADTGNLKEAAEHFRTYLQLAPDAPNAAAVKNELARVEQALSGSSAPATPSVPK